MGWWCGVGCMGLGEVRWVGGVGGVKQQDKHGGICVGMCGWGGWSVWGGWVMWGGWMGWVVLNTNPLPLRIFGGSIKYF